MPVLTAQEGYRLWAPSYAQETAISHLEHQIATAMMPPLDGVRLVDVGCGIGRRMLATGALSVTGIDPSREMLDAGVGADVSLPGLFTLVGDVRDLPLPDFSADLVWCRLVLGHLPEIGVAYAELARVAATGATVIVSDFHPAAYAAGHRRTFRNGDGVHEVEHYVHSAQSHIDAALAAGLTLADFREAAIGPDVEEFYRRADREALYREQSGLPVVIAFAFRREDRVCDC
jgi:malonyl-CoA O-methyltransferase